MMGDRRLGHVIAARDVAGTHMAGQRQLAQDCQSDRVGRGLQEQDLGIGLALHAVQCIDKCLFSKYQYSAPCCPTRRPA